MAPLLLGVFGFIGIFSMLSQPVAHAATNNSTINYQMRLLNSAGGIVPDGNYNIEFKLYDSINSTGSSQGSCSGDAHCLWVETWTSGNAVRVVNGYLTASLGSITSFGSNINWNQPLYLGVRIGGAGSPSWEAIELTSNGTAGGNKIALTAVPAALTANTLSNVVSSNQQLLQFANSFGQATTITLPDPGAGTATVCYQTSTACGFESTSGNDFIKNGTSTQTANFNIQSGSSSSIAAVIQGAASQSADLLDIKTSTPATVLSVGAGGAFTVSPADNTATILLGSNSQTGQITLGQSTATNTISIGSAAGNGNTQTINIGTSSTNGSTTNTTIGSTKGGTTLIQSPTTTVKPGSDSTTAFQVQNSGGGSLISVDSTNSNITLAGNNSGQLAAWSTNSNSLPGNRSDTGSSTVVANGYIYLVGGHDGTNPQSTVYYAKLNTDGSTGSWSTNANSLPAIRYAVSVVSANGYIYELGGADGSTNPQNNVYYAKLNADGSTGSWSSSSNTLPTALRYGRSIVANGYIYYIGGQNTAV